MHAALSLCCLAGERCCGLSAPAFKSELLFGKPVYYYLMVSNLLLRLSWTYKLSPHLRHNFDTVLLFTLLEVRRFWGPGLRGLLLVVKNCKVQVY